MQTSTEDVKQSWHNSKPVLKIPPASKHAGLISMHAWDNTPYLVTAEGKHGYQRSRCMVGPAGSQAASRQLM
jgi:hypothetical protein